MQINAFIQARMSSQRFPGKMLAPVGGIPVLERVFAAVGKVISKENIVVLTSEESSDDPLVCYTLSRGFQVVRGPLTNVFLRFQQGLHSHPCDYFFRVCGDSPLLDATLLRYALSLMNPSAADLVTNVFPRSFPRGQSVELIREKLVMDMPLRKLALEDQEHLTRFFYAHSEDYHMVNFRCPDGDLSSTSYALDTLEDWSRLESLCSRGEYPRFDMGGA